MTPEIRPAAIYTMGLSTSETQRLITQASLYEPITERMLESAGITTGMPSWMLVQARVMSRCSPRLVWVPRAQ